MVFAGGDNDGAFFNDLMRVNVKIDEHQWNRSILKESGILGGSNLHFVYETEIITYVTWSREMSHLSKMSIPIFLHHFLITAKCFILMQTPLQLDIWLQSYEEFDNAKNNMKQRNLKTVFANISKTTTPTSDSFLLIMSHLLSLGYLKAQVMEQGCKLQHACQPASGGGLSLQAGKVSAPLMVHFLKSQRNHYYISYWACQVVIVLVLLN